MKKSYKSMATVLVLWCTTLLGRNPFEFADQALKKYTTNKIQEVSQKMVPQTKQRGGGWAIVELKNNTTRIMKDDRGNVRSISVPDEK